MRIQIICYPPDSEVYGNAVRLTHPLRAIYLRAKVVPSGSAGKESACYVGDPSSIPGLGRSSGEGNGYPLQFSCLESSMNRGAWRAIVHGVTKMDTTKRLSLYLEVGRGNTNQSLPPGFLLN